MRKFAFPTAAAVALSLAFLGGLANAKDAEARYFNPCSGSPIEAPCYDVPDGCGTGVGCIHTECDNVMCPLQTGTAAGCHFCDN
jgi:hypothetical protein